MVRILVALGLVIVCGIVALGACVPVEPASTGATVSGADERTTAVASPPLATTPVPAANEGQSVDGWVGRVVAVAANGQAGTYLERSDGQRFGVGASDLAVRAQINAYRASGERVQVWGRLVQAAGQTRSVEVQRLQPAATEGGPDPARAPAPVPARLSRTS